MKSAIYLLTVAIAMSLASDSNESESEYQQIVASQQNFYQDLLNMSPSERQRLGINLNRDSQTVDFESMPMPLTYHINSMMGYSRMMNMMYPGQYDVSRFSTINMNRCGCQQICPPCYLPWLCIPCQCPCQTTAPPDSDTAPPPIDTTTTTEETTIPTTTTPEETTTCVPCTNPCNPCGPIWIPWVPCNNICLCNNGCQTITPAPAAPTTVAIVPKINNCQCECAPCLPFAPCPPCPRNCPCT